MFEVEGKRFWISWTLSAGASDLSLLPHQWPSRLLEPSDEGAQTLVQRHLMCRRVILGTWRSRKERDLCLLNQSCHPYASLWIQYGPQDCRGWWNWSVILHTQIGKASIFSLPSSCFFLVHTWKRIRTNRLGMSWLRGLRSQTRLKEPRIRQLSKHEVCLTLATLPTPTCLPSPLGVDFKLNFLHYCFSKGRIKSMPKTTSCTHSTLIPLLPINVFSICSFYFPQSCSFIQSKATN